MSQILSTHPPQHSEALLRHGEADAPRLRSRRPNALDKLALRLGLLLITYGRRRYALSREERALNAENARTCRARELDWERARLTLVPQR